MLFPIDCNAFHYRHTIELDISKKNKKPKPKPRA